MEDIKKKLMLALILFAIPVLGLLTSIYVASDYESQFKQVVVPSQITEVEYANRGLSYLSLCRKGGALHDNSETAEMCKFANEVVLTRQISLATFGLGILLVALIFMAKSVSGVDRKKLVLIFSPTVRLVMLLLAVSILAQAGIFIYSIYTLEASTIHRVHSGFLLIVGFVAIVGCFQLLKAALGFFKTTPTLLRDKELSRQDNPELFNLVSSISGKLKAQVPDHIVAGLEPNFFVTSNNVVLAGLDGRELKGRTLFVSLSLMNILTKEELASVIGHELGHFRGEDTEYSLKFAPIYSKLGMGLYQMETNAQGAGAVATLPAIAVLNLCLEQFATAERTIGRQRELIADKAGAEASSAEDLANTLVKISLFTGLWNVLTHKYIEILSEGNYLTNLAQTYRILCEEAHSDLN